MIPSKQSSLHRHMFRLLLSVSLLLMAFGFEAQATRSQDAGTLTNPLNLDGGADPWLTYYEGNYYLAATTWASEWRCGNRPRWPDSNRRTAAHYLRLIRRAAANFGPGVHCWMGRMAALVFLLHGRHAAWH